jgi:uncharacterized protein (TIGR02145 family)
MSRSSYALWLLLLLLLPFSCVKLPGNLGDLPIPPLPPVPVISSVVSGDGSVTVTWSAATGATSYKLYYMAGTSIDKSSATMLEDVISPKYVINLTNGTQYAFAVSGVNGAGESALSAVQNGIPQPNVVIPPAPVISSAVAGNGSVTVTWNNVTGAVSYNLYYKAGPTVDMATGTKISGAASPHIVNALTNGSQYTFAVSTVTATSQSGLSNVVSATPQAVSGTVTDIDGDVYHTVTIGTQVWMVENLKTTKYNDGTAIPLVTDSSAWAALTTPGYCWYNNNAATYKNTYGALYNWYAVNTGKLAPTGWHVPTDSEWTVLTTYLGGDSAAGGPLKEVGTTHWAAPNTGATNTSGFSALPGGFRGSTFYDVGSIGYWWSSTAYDAAYSWNRDIFYDSAYVYRYNHNSDYGFSVRCVKN